MSCITFESDGGLCNVYSATITMVFSLNSWTITLKLYPIYRNLSQTVSHLGLEAKLGGNGTKQTKGHRTVMLVNSATIVLLK